MLHNDVNIIGGLYFASGPVANPVGIALGVGGGTPVAVAGANLITRVIGFNGGAIAFTNSSGSNLVRVGTWQSAGPFTTGTPNISDRVDLQCHGQATDRNRLASIQQSSDTFGHHPRFTDREPVAGAPRHREMAHHTIDHDGTRKLDVSI